MTYVKQRQIILSRNWQVNTFLSLKKNFFIISKKLNHSENRHTPSTWQLGEYFQY